LVPDTTVQSDLDRAVSHDPNQDWPDKIEIAAYWGKRKRWIAIDADQFFGRNTHGAPMSGEQLIAAVDRLRRMGPDPVERSFAEIRDEAKAKQVANK
jgi:hypothetical protein